MSLKTLFFLEIGLFVTVVICGAGTVYAAEPSPCIPDEAIEQFLFRINENVKSKVKALDANPVQNLLVPVFGVTLNDLEDTWGAPRSGGRKHEGIDIMAPQGTIIVSPTKAVVTNVGYDDKGGHYVITANPGGEQFYYAHLNKVAKNLTSGSELVVGDLIGYVGNTGNARERATHLHLGIYYKCEAMNPYPRLTKEFSSNEVNGLMAKMCLRGNDMEIGSEGVCVRFLQQFLIDQNSGSSAQKLTSAGATGYFGSLTRNALAEYQTMAGINPALGYFGPITGGYILTTLSPVIVSSQVAVEIETREEQTTDAGLENIENQLASIAVVLAQLTESIQELMNR